MEKASDVFEASITCNALILKSEVNFISQWSWQETQLLVAIWGGRYVIGSNWTLYGSYFCLYCLAKGCFLCLTCSFIYFVLSTGHLKLHELWWKTSMFLCNVKTYIVIMHLSFSDAMCQEVWIWFWHDFLNVCTQIILSHDEKVQKWFYIGGTLIQTNTSLIILQIMRVETIIVVSSILYAWSGEF